MSQISLTVQCLLSVLEAEKTLYQANAKKAAADLKAAIEARAASAGAPGLEDQCVKQVFIL